MNREAANNLGINLKGKIGQFFCKHQNKKCFAEHTDKFHSLRGETRVYICEDCGKEIDRFVAEYEGSGFK